MLFADFLCNYFSLLFKAFVKKKKTQKHFQKTSSSVIHRGKNLTGDLSVCLFVKYPRLFRKQFRWEMLMHLKKALVLWLKLIPIFEASSCIFACSCSTISRKSVSLFLLQLELVCPQNTVTLCETSAYPLSQRFTIQQALFFSLKLIHNGKAGMWLATDEHSLNRSYCSPLNKRILLQFQKPWRCRLCSVSQYKWSRTYIHQHMPASPSCKPRHFLRQCSPHLV